MTPRCGGLLLSLAADVHYYADVVIEFEGTVFSTLRATINLARGTKLFAIAAGASAAVHCTLDNTRQSPFTMYASGTGMHTGICGYTQSRLSS